MIEKFNGPSFLMIERFNGSLFLMIEEFDGWLILRAFLIERDCVYVLQNYLVVASHTYFSQLVEALLSTFKHNHEKEPENLGMKKWILCLVHLLPQNLF